ncbi:MAG: hypothetical protein GY804_08890 [Alphaproteobacteria bacterium]|nr:hypothetical protein [Alphaproteobacteria bacterium]
MELPLHKEPKSDSHLITHITINQYCFKEIFKYSRLEEGLCIKRKTVVVHATKQKDLSDHSKSDTTPWVVGNRYISNVPFEDAAMCIYAPSLKMPIDLPEVITPTPSHNKKSWVNPKHYPSCDIAEHAPAFIVPTDIVIRDMVVADIIHPEFDIKQYLNTSTLKMLRHVIVGTTPITMLYSPNRAADKKWNVHKGAVQYTNKTIPHRCDNFTRTILDTIATDS